MNKLNIHARDLKQSAGYVQQPRYYAVYMRHIIAHCNSIITTINNLIHS